MKNRKLNVMMIGAHPDDCEIKTGGIAIKYRELGHNVKFISATKGDTGHFKIGMSELAGIRCEESKKSCGLSGIESQILNISNNRIEADIPTREMFISLIREFKPDLIFTHRLNDYHPDHRRTAMLVQDSSYAIRIPAVCPLTPYLTYTPVILYMYDTFNKPWEFDPVVVIDTDDIFEKKIQMLHCHKSQFYEWIPWIGNELKDVPKTEEERLDWLRNKMANRFGAIANRYRIELARQYGEEHSKTVKTAEAFELSEYGKKMGVRELPSYFPFLTFQ